MNSRYEMAFDKRVAPHDRVEAVHAIGKQRRFEYEDRLGALVRSEENVWLRAAALSVLVGWSRNSFIVDALDLLFDDSAGADAIAARQRMVGSLSAYARSNGAAFRQTIAWHLARKLVDGDDEVVLLAAYQNLLLILGRPVDALPSAVAGYDPNGVDWEAVGEVLASGPHAPISQRLKC